MHRKGIKNSEMPTILQDWKSILLNWRYSITSVWCKSHDLKPKCINVLVSGLNLDLCEYICHNFWFVEYCQFNEIEVIDVKLNLENVWRQMMKMR